MRPKDIWILILGAMVGASVLACSTYKSRIGPLKMGATKPKKDVMIFAPGHVGCDDWLGACDATSCYDDTPKRCRAYLIGFERGVNFTKTK